MFKTRAARRDWPCSVAEVIAERANMWELSVRWPTMTKKSGDVVRRGIRKTSTTEKCKCEFSPCDRIKVAKER